MDRRYREPRLPASWGLPIPCALLVVVLGILCSLPSFAADSLKSVEKPANHPRMAAEPKLDCPVKPGPQESRKPAEDGAQRQDGEEPASTLADPSRGSDVALRIRSREQLVEDEGNSSTSPKPDATLQSPQCEDGGDARVRLKKKEQCEGLGPVSGSPARCKPEDGPQPGNERLVTH